MKRLLLLIPLLLFSCTTSVEEEPVEPIEATEELVVDFSTTDIQISDGVQHSVPLDDILSGGPPKDGIPSIDDPVFLSNDEADFLSDDEIGIMVDLEGEARFYPYSVLVWHEIVNDQIGDQAILVTYCPLCGSGIVFDPIVNDEVSEFGTSGKLWNSNLVMYDRQTDSYWSQILGEAIIGEMTGTRLDLLPSQIMKWSSFKSLHPEGQVLSTDTGYSRDYTRTPYSGYEDSISIFFPVDHSDDSFHPKAPAFGIEIDGVYKAYLQEYLEDGEFTDELNGVELLVSYNQETQEFLIKRTDTDEVIVPFYNFWFSWFAVHPETLVWPESV